MRKLLLAVLLFVMVVWAAQPLLLLSPEDNGPKSISSNKTFRAPIRSFDLKSPLKNSKDISIANYEIQYHNYNWYYYMPRPVEDTQMTRFTPPTECSLVAFTVIHYNSTTGQVGQPYYLFVADQRTDLTYDSLMNMYMNLGFYEILEFIVPHGNKFPGYEEIASTAKGNGEWDTIQTAIYIPFEDWDPTTPGDPESHEFFCGYRPGTNNFAILSTGEIPAANAYESHSYRYRNQYGIWYGYYFSDGNNKLEFGISAYIKALRNIPPTITIDYLPNTYSTSGRIVTAYITDFGVPTESTGVEVATVEYDINGTPQTPITMTLFDGDSVAGGYYAIIPGANVGDVVTYRIVAQDYQGKSVESPYWSYTIKQGTPGNALYVRGNGTAIFNDYIENNYLVDVWDIAAENGPPDATVIAFYTPTLGTGTPAVVWKGWGERGLSFHYYGSGYTFIGDTAYIATLIDNGGFFWFEDQDGLYGIDYETWNDYGQHDATPNSFVHRYFGILTATDDGTWAGNTNYEVYGDPADPVIGTLFSGTVGYQTTEGMIMHGGMGGDFTGGREWAGSFDSYESYATPEMSASDGTVLALRQEITKGGKAVFHIFGSSWLVDPANPTTIYDTVASNYLQDCYLTWAGVTGIKEPSNDAKVIEISKPWLNDNDVIMNVTLPTRGFVKVLVHDISGRVIGKAYEGEFIGTRPVYYNTIRMNPGTYFMSVYVNGDLKGARKFILVK